MPNESPNLAGLQGCVSVTSIINPIQKGEKKKQHTLLLVVDDAQIHMPVRGNSEIEARSAATPILLSGCSNSSGKYDFGGMPTVVSNLKSGVI